MFFSLRFPELSHFRYKRPFPRLCNRGFARLRARFLIGLDSLYLRWYRSGVPLKYRAKEQRGVSIEAVIWDFGGVFTTSPFEAFNRYETERRLPRDFIRTVNSTNPDRNAWALLERSEINTAEFDRKFLEESTALGHPLRGAEVLRLLSGDVRPRMFRALIACKTRFKNGCITNNVASNGSGPGMADTAERALRVGEIMQLFDAVIESSKTGVRKPDPRIYLMMCELLGVAPAGCLYLDDLGINCKPAAQLGMTAIKVVSEEQALSDLARATGLALR